MSRSGRAALVVTGLTIAAVAAPFAAGIGLLAQILIALLALAVGGHAVARLARPDILSLKIDGSRLQVRYRSGLCASGQLAGTPFVSPLFIGLRWRPADKRLSRPLGLFREQLAEADFRQLCAVLRQQAA